MGLNRISTLLGAAAIASAAASADAAEDFKCAKQETFIGPYYSCNTAAPDKRKECNAINKENLASVAKVFGLSQIRMNGNDMGICATWNNDQMGPLPKPALKAFE